ncbi:DUF4157 domain-containing protein [Brevibacillus borstelensis]|uniref:eCIS core domain-containing protein n=1 Tax=Brevibacillus borstelensis TaxID=45462 RepID=UPI0030BF54DC
MSRQPIAKHAGSASLIHMQAKAVAERQAGGVFPIQRTARDPDSILALQKAIGNKAVQRMLSSSPIEESREQPFSTGSGQHLPDAVQTKMEHAFHSDFSQVQVFPHSTVAENIGAVAFAQGNDIHFAPGAYRPDTKSGQKLLGHELTHVVQQREGRVKPNLPGSDLPINDDPGLEREADLRGLQAAAGEAVEKSSS